MANYNDLITAIDSVIKTNNRREITGQLLQNVLNTMVGSLGENYQLAGFATPTTNPHQPDQNVFYVASQAGVYTQFDNIVLGDGISFLMWKNGAWTSQTISNVTQSWVQQNFVSKEWFRKVFRVYDEDGLEIVPNDMDSVVDNIKAMVGLWTNEYLSALGMGRDGGGSTQTLAQLNDVQLGTLVNGDALVYNTAIHKWENKQIQAGIDMSTVWAALAANTKEQINSSHLATALSGYVTTEALGTALQNYATQSWVNQNFATQSWVNQNFITVEWFDKLFQLYNGTEAVANKIAPNGALPVDQTQLNIEAMFGFWTKKYISALGKGDDGTTSYNTLAQLNDVTLTNPTANQILVYDGTHWRNQNQQSVYVLPVATTTILGGIKVGYTTSGKNYKVQLDASNNAYVNVPWTDTTYTLAGLMGSTAKGSTTQPIYWNGSEFANTTYTLGAACAKGVTDNSSNADVTSSDTNLITGRTLYYQLAKKGYTTNTGTVTSVATGTGLTGGTITGAGTISIDSTYQTYISHGETAYGWGNHANAGYAAASSLSNYLPLAGGTLNGSLTFSYNNRNLRIKTTSESQGIDIPAVDEWLIRTDNTNTQLLIGNVGIGLYSPSHKLHVNGNIATSADNGTFVQIGAIRLQYDSSNNAIKVVKSDGTAANLYATGGVSALGAGQESGGGGDVTWALLASPATGGRSIHSSYISSTLSNYLLLSGGTMSGTLNMTCDTVEMNFRTGHNSYNSKMEYMTYGDEAMVWANQNAITSFIFKCGLNLSNTSNWAGITPSLQIKNQSVYINSLIANGATPSYNLYVNGSANATTLYENGSRVITSGNIGSQSVNYASSAGSVAWGNVSGRPTNVSAFTNDSGYATQSWVNTRLGNYLPLGGGVMTGQIKLNYNNRDIVLKTTASNSGLLIEAADEWLICSNGSNTNLLIGNVGIGNYFPSYKLHVTGTVGATGFTNTSDIRNKSVVKDVNLRLDQIAKAPAFEYYWLDTSIDHDLHVGTSAQYWESVLPQVVTTAKDEMGTKALQYGVAALISAITVARKVMTHEEKISLLETRVSALEKENGEQEQLINSLQEELANLKQHNYEN